jgi:GT2 family glycosyltransferase/ADP-heptose:LPS heptosyltransferase
MIYKEVYILVLTWNQKDITLKFLEHLKNLTYPSIKTIVVDNGSTDGTSDEIKKNFTEVILLNLPYNTGCAGGRNIGIQYFLNRTDGEYLFFLDNDLYLEEDFIEKTLKVFEGNSNAGVVGGILYYQHTSRIQWAGIKTNWTKGEFVPIFKDRLIQDIVEKNVDAVPGAITLAKREVFEKVPYIDESYFIYYEDPDWCLRVKEKGYGILFVPYLKFYHNCSSSLGMESPSFYYYRTRNRLKFFYKNGSSVNFIVFFLYFIFWNFPYQTLLTLYLNNQPLQFKASLLGVFDFLRGRFGKRNFKKDNDEFLDISFLVFLSRRFDRYILRKFNTTKRYIKFLLKGITRRPLNILINSAWRLGDEIMALPVYEKIRERYPESRIDVVCNYPEILAGYDFVDFIKDPVIRKYDLVINLKGEDPTISRKENIERKLRIKISYYPEIKIKAEQKKNIIGLSTGSGWKCKCWPKESFSRLAGLFGEKGFEVRAFGLSGEEIETGKDYTGTSLKEAINNLKDCRIFIGNDSGLLHLALALQIPSVGIFGPTTPESLFKNNPLLYPVESPVFCQGCWNNGLMKHPGICPYGMPDCMENIKVDDVLQKVEAILKK